MEKPRAMLLARGPLLLGFTELKRALMIQDGYLMDLTSIESVSLEEFADLREIGATTLRKMQLLNALLDNGVPTTTDIVIGLCAELSRAFGEILASGVLDDAATNAVRDALGAVHSCGIAVGTMLGPGEVVELD